MNRWIEGFDRNLGPAIRNEDKAGATRQNRTDDPLITNEMLYQLS